MFTLNRAASVAALTLALFAAPLVSREIDSAGSFDIVGTGMMKVNGKRAPMSFLGWFDYDFDTHECALYLDDLAVEGTLGHKGNSGEWAADFKSGFKLAYQEENDGDVVKVARYRVTKLVFDEGLVSGRISARYRVVAADGTKQTVTIEGSFAGTDMFGF